MYFAHPISHIKFKQDRSCYLLEKTTCTSNYWCGWSIHQHTSYCQMPKSMVAVRSESVQINRSKHIVSPLSIFCSRFYRILSGKNQSSDQQECIWNLRHTHSSQHGYVYSIILVEQCQWLQNEISTDPVLQQCLLEPAIAKAIVRDTKEDISKQDRIKTLRSARKHQSLNYITCTDFVAASWCRL